MDSSLVDSSTGLGGKFEVCRNEINYVVGGRMTGFVLCENGIMHRPDGGMSGGGECISMLPREDVGCVSTHPEDMLDGLGLELCSFDSDCVDGVHGTCDPVATGVTTNACGCSYGCTRDSDCQADELCLCGEPVGRCVKSDCKSDQGCEGGLCISVAPNSNVLGFCSEPYFKCQTEHDACWSLLDCPESQACYIRRVWITA